MAKKPIFSVFFRAFLVTEVYANDVAAEKLPTTPAVGNAPKIASTLQYLRCDVIPSSSFWDKWNKILITSHDHIMFTEGLLKNIFVVSRLYILMISKEKS